MNEKRQSAWVLKRSIVSGIAALTLALSALVAVGWVDGPRVARADDCPATVAQPASPDAVARSLDDADCLSRPAARSGDAGRQEGASVRGVWDIVRGVGGFVADLVDHVLEGLAGSILDTVTDHGPFGRFPVSRPVTEPWEPEPWQLEWPQE